MGGAEGKNKFLCIGLFGTCGKSIWRDKFIEAYTQLEIPYFNPQVEDWKPELAQVEAEHLANDRVVLFPVLSETYGCGSLAETGFSILQAIKLDDRRQFVIMIEKTLDDELMGDNATAKESIRARALVSEHLKKLKLSNVFVVDSLGEMLRISIKLFEAEAILQSLRSK